jgi:adenylate cyclase
LGAWLPIRSPRQLARRAGRLIAAVVAFIMIGLFLGFVAVLFHLEERVGLDLLFLMRGARQPPPEVMVLGIDQESATVFGLHTDPARWPRSLHGRMVEQLARLGARTIVFDMVFDQPGAPEEDESFARAVKRAGNVVLAEFLRRETHSAPGAAGAPAAIVAVEERVPPVAPLATAATALAPFPLPKVPVKVNQYWTFKTDHTMPTLPVAAFQVFALDAYDSFLRLVREADPQSAQALPASREAVLATGHVGPLIHAVRAAFERRPELGEQLLARLRAQGPDGLPADRQRVLATLVEMYQEPSSRYLNFYGPPGTIPVVSYHHALPEAAGTAPPPDVAGKAVFIGLAESGRSHQRDGFYTVYSQPNGVDLNGVEIAATAFANLLTASPVKALDPGWSLATIVGGGIVIGALVSLLPPAHAVLALLGVGAAYFLAARHQFESATRWWLLVTPLGLQLPVAILGALAWGYATTHRERANVRRALGYYLPSDVADRIADDVGHLKAGSSLLHGTCVSTDAHQYTTLAETLGPAELGAVMNRYYAALFEPVKRHGGIVQDVVGDSMLAIWATATDDAGLRRRACAAALDIARAVDRFNQESATTPLPTRIGLHSGQMLIGNVGAIDHYEYRATGDIVNTATRLENLNKYLGTQILASAEVLEGLTGFLTRPLGRFLVVGKSRPVDVVELIGLAEEAAPDVGQRCASFAAGLAFYREQSWKQALECFDACLAVGPQDGPPRFYAGLCRQYAEHPPDTPWDGVVRMDRK